MNPTSKKFISLFLVFSLLMINCISLRTTGGKREKSGTELIITKKVGRRVEGELITVKENSLLILNTEGKDVSVEIEEIKRIDVLKKSKGKLGRWAIIGGGIGVLIGGGIGVAKGLASEDELLTPGVSAFLLGSLYGAVGGAAGALIGTLIGVFAGVVDEHASKYKTFQIEEMNSYEVNKTLDYLRKKARVRDYK